MKAKTWVIVFLALLLALLLALAAFNFFVDPFGVFGNRTWYSFSETLNPRVAKTAYLMENGGKYDSFLVGCSSTSSYPKDALDKYLNANFYNTICYGADMGDTVLTVRWLLENCTVKNIFLNVYIDNGLTYGTGEDDVSYKLHEAVSGTGKPGFYGSYLLADPAYAFDKLKALRDDQILPQSFDVFDEESGAYDKRVRDVEQIGSLADYYAQYPVFTDYPKGPSELGFTKECMQDVGEIVRLCEDANVRLFVVCAPVYRDYFEGYSDAAIREFYTALADVTDYWDFSYSSVSCEPRYFYDATHFRNDVGRMLLAKMFDDKAVYVPADFGEFVTKDTVSDHVQTMLARKAAANTTDYTCELPVLTYHNVEPQDDGNNCMTTEVFEEQMQAICDAGYTAVGLQEIYDYVNQGTELPDKPILITFDDGYRSNYTIAYPILKQLGMKAVIFTIGVSVGKDTYKDTGVPICPHFSYAEAKKMLDSGVISIESHTFDLHQSETLDPEPVRRTANILPGETQEHYAGVFAADLAKSMQSILDGTGHRVTALSYPEGEYTILSEVLCKDAGLKATFTTKQQTNTLVKGLPQCLYGMGRFSVPTCSGEELLALLTTQ